MKFIKNSVLSILFVVVMLIGLTGCDNFKRNSASSLESKVEEKKKKIVTIWTKDRHDAEFQLKKIEEYNLNNPDNIEIKYSIFSDNYLQAVDLAFQSNSAPDILVFTSQVFNNYVVSGKFADLTPFMDEEFKETFSSSMIEGLNVIDGKCYYIPTAATICRLFYNKDIFERVGVLEPPRTLHEMVEIAQKITKELSGEGIYGFSANMKYPNSALNRSLMPMAQIGLGIRSGFDFKKGVYDFSGYQTILEEWRTLLSPECAYPNSNSLDIDPLRKLFAAGKIGMYMSYTHSELGVYENQFPMEQEWRCTEIPVVDGIILGAQNSSLNNGYLFNAKSKDLDAAWKAYVSVFADIDNLAEYHSQGLGISTVPKVLERATLNQSYIDNPALLVGENDKIWPKVPHEANVNAVVVDGLDMYNTFAELIYGTMDIKEGLSDLTKRYNKAYQEGINSGIGEVYKIDNFDPLNP